MLVIVVPGLLISLMLAILALRQAVHFDQPAEMQRNTVTSYGLMYYYLAGTALFNFGFMVMITQRLVVKLRHASRRDALTGLLNRRAMDEEIEREWQRCLRGRPPFAVLLVDIDGFKGINDSQGHVAGDRVLAHVARLLHRHARTTDAVARIGGDEFLLLLVEVDETVALRSAERIRLEVERQPLQTGTNPVPATISIGVALLGRADPNAEAVIARADTALYRAKTEGRNRVDVAGVRAE